MIVSNKCLVPVNIWGGTVSSWLVRSTSERAVRVRALAGDIVLCSWTRRFTFTVPLSTQVYKWVPANLMLGVTLRWTSIPSRGKVEILLVASCYRIRGGGGALGLYADFTLPKSKYERWHIYTAEKDMKTSMIIAVKYTICVCSCHDH